ncbi:MAG: beta-ketoacyl synthase chain length factor [Prevotella sp.]|nr:beta-ketoacyl synthase chain length factor [Prevotella sp.]
MVAVAGIGIISAIGIGQEETVKSLREQRSGIGKMRYLDSKHTELPVGEVKKSDDELKEILGVPHSDEVSRTALLGAIALKQAIEDAKMSPPFFFAEQSGRAEREGAEEGPRVALISGTTVGALDGDCGSNTEEIARLAGLKDIELCTISTACSSALNAIIVGCEMIKNDEADIVIAGGTEALSRFHLNGFNSLMILDHEPCRPFDASRAGLNLGEGAAYVVIVSSHLSPLTSNLYIVGYGNRCDAFHQTATSENGEGAYLAMTEALRSAGLSPKDIDYVNAHGTGTPDNDLSESIALKRVFGDHMPPVSSTKGYTGHTTSASGSIEAVISILAIQHDFIPTNLGWHQQMENGITPVHVPVNVPVNTVLCNSFGFGGNDSSVILGVRGTMHCITEATIDNEEQLKDTKEFIPPMAARRMGKLMKAAMVATLKALKEAGIETPDAIITATAYGMWEMSMTFTEDMNANDEESLSPTLFMQSTHNTIGSAIAIRTKCHGYNVTYSQGRDSIKWAMRDAERLLHSGQAQNVLVVECDEKDGLFVRSKVVEVRGKRL